MAFCAMFPTTLNLSISSTTHCYRVKLPLTTSKVVTVRASSTEESEDNDKDNPSFNPFGLVTDNPSSHSVIKLPESAAEDSNVGYVIILFFSSFFFFCSLGLLF
ncbi:hypothetical protein Lal_00017377 [Lupinus albus]|uniref:Uncharacterized protein n=1 Tax=Lupinus albus TaxID=3870 RepID=A0A6A5MEA3_LUPAL|nr:hypothetical protein Lalb_Chr04g0262331 [Lupinus albus]KAF1869800.1 hypothetical protein Lal_00017377 [Lupinus albus]